MNRGRFRLLAACAIAATALTACTPPGPAADLVLTNGKIVTLDADRPEVDSLAIRDGKIVALGTEGQMGPIIGIHTRVIDLHGALATPGWIEGHGHFIGLGHSFLNIRLTEARSWEEIVSRVAEAAALAEPGQWILGWGWHQEKWDRPPPDEVEGYPTHELLSRAVPDHPVLLKHAAGSHAGLVNLKAMELAGIGPDTPDPRGGTILRDAVGAPTGLLRERAYGLALAAHADAMASRSAEEIAAQIRRQIELADAECLENGITSFQDAGSDFETVDLLREMAEAGQIGVRLWVMLRDEIGLLEQRAADYRIVGAGADHLTVRAVKQSVDGALGSHGAWLLEPYEDLRSSSGLNTTPLEEIERAAALSMEHDLQLAVHAIGDRGNREILDLFERTFAAHPERSDLRWRIEHAQHLSVEDIPRFAELGVIASMQGVHCTSDGPWVPQRLGAGRSEQGAYVWRKLIDSGATVINGTDVPVEDLDPIVNFHASVTRRMDNGEAFFAGQAMTRMEALRSYTIDAARAAFEEDVKGSLEPGKLADITVLSLDILSVPEEQLLDTEVLYTIVGGEVKYDRNAEDDPA